MKKLIIQIILLIIPLTSFAWAPISWNVNSESSDVVATVESGTYDKIIDVKLISNDERAKIFYYTDKIGRFDEQIEYKAWSKITFSKNTTINYHSISKNETASLIKENIYNFVYPEKISLSYLDNSIIIKNNENKDIDLRWWIIWWKEFLYTTNINSNDSYKYNYQMNEWETINLISPDEKVNIQFKYIIPKKVETQKIIKNTNLEKTENTQKEENITQTWISENKIDAELINTWIIQNNTWNTEEITNIDNSNISTWIKEEIKNTANWLENNNFNNNLKTSIIDSAQEKKTNPLILIIWIMILIWVIWWIYIKLEKNKES